MVAAADTQRAAGETAVAYTMEGMKGLVGYRSWGGAELCMVSDLNCALNGLDKPYIHGSGPAFDLTVGFCVGFCRCTLRLSVTWGPSTLSCTSLVHWHWRWGLRQARR